MSPCVFRLRFVAACLLAVSALVGSGSRAAAQYSRVTPLVEAIKKAEPSVVGIFLPKQETVNGSGIIIDKRGLVVTNHHVVGKNREVVVRLHDGTKVPGEVILDRPGQGSRLRPLQERPELAGDAPKSDSDLFLGESVIAIGHPLGYIDTVSAGIVSAKNREITLPTGGKLTKLIQTNADINPGNSGGPLININGGAGRHQRRRPRSARTGSPSPFTASP